MSTTEEQVHSSKFYESVKKAKEGYGSVKKHIIAAIMELEQEGYGE